ncbi:MAG: hypothetical protein ACLPY5_03615 [Candidatus Bathyarchaeia archaeon]
MGSRRVSAKKGYRVRRLGSIGGLYATPMPLAKELMKIDTAVLPANFLSPYSASTFPSEENIRLPRRVTAKKQIRG